MAFNHLPFLELLAPIVHQRHRTHNNRLADTMRSNKQYVPGLCHSEGCNVHGRLVGEGRLLCKIIRQGLPCMTVPLTQHGVNECDGLECLAQTHLIRKNASLAFRTGHSHDTRVHKLMGVIIFELSYADGKPLTLTPSF